MTTLTDIKEVARAFYETDATTIVTNFSQYIDANVVNHANESARTHEGWLATDKVFFGSFDDVQVEVLDQVAEGDKVASRWVFTGRQASDFAGIPTTGRTGTLAATTVDRVVDGKIVEHWIDVDFGSFLRQLAE
jgi:predicted ester cyclase